MILVSLKFSWTFNSLDWILFFHFSKINSWLFFYPQLIVSSLSFCRKNTHIPVWRTCAFTDVCSANLRTAENLVNQGLRNIFQVVRLKTIVFSSDSSSCSLRSFLWVCSHPLSHTWHRRRKWSAVELRQSFVIWTMVNMSVWGLVW